MYSKYTKSVIFFIQSIMRLFFMLLKVVLLIIYFTCDFSEKKPLTGFIELKCIKEIKHLWVHNQNLDLESLFSDNLVFKDALPGMRQFSSTESSLNIRKHAFYFVLEIISILKGFKFFSITFLMM